MLNKSLQVLGNDSEYRFTKTCILNVGILCMMIEDSDLFKNTFLVQLAFKTVESQTYSYILSYPCCIFKVLSQV